MFTLCNSVGPNLIYKVLPKPDTQEEHLKHMANWILARYPDSSGIIYCLTKKDTETVCRGLYNESHGRIRCAMYHADMESVRTPKRSSNDTCNNTFAIAGIRCRMKKITYIHNGVKTRYTSS